MKKKKIVFEPAIIDVFIVCIWTLKRDMDIKHNCDMKGMDGNEIRRRQNAYGFNTSTINIWQIQFLILQRDKQKDKMRWKKIKCISLQLVLPS